MKFLFYVDILVKIHLHKWKMTIFSVILWTSPGTANEKNGEPNVSDLILVAGSQGQWRSRRSIQNSVLSVLLQTEKGALSLVFSGFVCGSLLENVERFLLYKTVWLVSSQLSCWRRNKPKTPSWICFLVITTKWRYSKEKEGRRLMLIRPLCNKRLPKGVKETSWGPKGSKPKSQSNQSSNPSGSHFPIPFNYYDIIEISQTGNCSNSCYYNDFGRNYNSISDPNSCSSDCN